MNTVFLEKICRCCLNESEDMRNLFDTVISVESYIFEQTVTYSDLINLCTNVRCDFDVVDTNDHIVEFPRNVCGTCVEELSAAFVFRKKCESSDGLLRQQTGMGLSSQVTEEVPEFDLQTKRFRLLEISLNETQPNEDVLREAEKISKVDLNALENEVIERNAEEILTNQEHLPFDPKDQISNCIRDTILNAPISTEDCEKFASKPDVPSEPTHHDEDVQFKCDECSKEFYSEKAFLAHSNLHQDFNRKKKYLCSTCGKLFTTRHRLQLHAITHSGDKSFGCDECDKQFTSESRLRCHRRTHTGEKPYRCDQCDLTFAQGNALRCHKRIHTGEKPYECHICNKRFTQNTILKTHMTLHTGKTIKCPDCDKLFSRKSNLILHRREHTGEKPYECPQCWNRYKQKCHLDRHMDTHLGVKHTCEICHKMYSKRWSLKVHMFSHSKDKPHQCAICEAQFARRDKYRIHMKSVHGLSTELVNVTTSTENDETNENALT